MDTNAMFFPRSDMIILNAFRDFADGLSRGLSLFFSERNDHVEQTLLLHTKRR
jgi:hypothetical protein